MRKMENSKWKNIIEKLHQSKTDKSVVIVLIIVLIITIGAITVQKTGIINITKNRIEELKQTQIETDIQNIIDRTKQEIQEKEAREAREATISDLKESFEKQGYSLNETTGEVKYNDYYVTINSDLTIAKIEKIETKTECKIMKVNAQNMETLITVENIGGIEKITTEDITLDCKGKNKIALDRTLENGKLYPISVKLVGKEEEEQYTVVVERKPIISIANMDTTGDGTTKTIKIEYNTNQEDSNNYYSLDDGATWQEYTEELNILEEENRTITAKSSAKQEKIKGKLIQVEATEDLIPIVISRSLLEATEKAVMKNDTYYKVAIKDEVYSVHTYIQNEDLVLAQNKVYGTAKDAGTASTNANSMVLVKVNGNMTINSGVTVTSYGTAYGGTKGMLLYVTGKLENNGTITMTAKGAKAVGQNVYLWKNEDASERGEYEFVPKVGGGGGAAVYAEIGKNGTAGTARRTGGGGSGASPSIGHFPGTPGRGGNGTSYSGGPGGGGTQNSTGQQGDDNGGAGGRAGAYYKYSDGIGGGAGNPGGACQAMYAKASPGGNGTGGLLILYSNSIENKGAITSNGANGGNGQSAGGGASGGGSINIFFKESITEGTINANGGNGGTQIGVTEGFNGGNGGDGCISIGNISTGSYRED